MPSREKIEHRPSSSRTREGLQSFDLSGKVAVVTGGAGVLGGSIAIGLARAGAKAAILGRTTDAG